MNFLAHIILSHNNEDLILGNFMADFLKNKEIVNYSESIQKGIYLHRQIDDFTDNHELVRKGTKRLRANQGKYAPVVIDILYDHILAVNWHIYSDIGFKDFISNVYELFFKRMDEMPVKLQMRLPYMISDGFLEKYESREGLEFTLKMMDRRTKFPSNFYKASDQLYKEWDMFDEEFSHFFPELIQLSEAFL